jgi:UDP-2,4-diacetamido-2,4,6-trideoxy-beta-L-altropyranose hydrolase
MTKKVIFRADGSSTTGLGHLYRLFSLVEVVKDTIDFVFLTRETSTDSVIPESYTKKSIPKNINIREEPEWLAANFSPKEHIVIADGYQFTASYQKQIKQKGYSLIYIDDLAKEHMYADVVINHSPYIQEKHYKKEPYTKLALGTQYALLRPLFLKEAKQNKTIKTVDCAFVCFGGADPFNLTLKAVEALLLIPSFKKIHVVLGGAHKHQEVFGLENKHSDKIKIYRNLSEGELIKTMQKCNFAVAPASTILYELSCVKMPIFSGFYIDNQELIYKGFLNNGAIYKGKNMKDYQVSDFVNKINIILDEHKFNNQIEAQKGLFDDKIVSRHLNLIKETMLTIGLLCSGELGLDTLSKINNDHTIQFVLTDRNSTGIIDFAINNDIPFYAGIPRKGKGYSFIKDFNVDVIASINYLFLIEEDIINHSNLLTFNIHGSLLPKYRGRTPHVWAIINGEDKAGITAHIIDAGCDTGKIIHQIEIPIEVDDTGAIMLKKYAKAYYPLVKKVLKDVADQQLNLTTQNDADATYFGKRTPADGEINWNWTKEVIRNWVRAQANPYPGAFTFYNNQKIIIDKVSFSEEKTSNKQGNGEIIQLKPNVVVKTKNGAINIDIIRTPFVHLNNIDF